MGSACKFDLSVRYKESDIEEMRRQLGIFQQQSQHIIDSELLDETVHKKFQQKQSLKKTIELCLMKEAADYKRELEKLKTVTLNVEMVESHIKAHWKEGTSLETKKEFLRIPLSFILQRRNCP